MISIIYDEIGDIWDEMWTWDDVVDRFEKGHLWLVFDEGSHLVGLRRKVKEDLYIYNTYLKPELRGKGLTKTLLLIRNNLFYDSFLERLYV